MRLLGRLLSILLLLGALTWLLMPLKDWAESVWFSDQKTLENLPAEARSATVFWLKDDEWTRFNLSSDTNLVRLLAHVQLPQGEYEDNYSPQFAVRYQLIGSGGEILRDAVYHFETALPGLSQLGDGRSFARRFYADPNLQATFDQYLFFRTDSLGDVREVRLKPAELPQADSRIGVRMAKLETLNPDQAARSWQRMNEAQKAERVEGLIFPHYLASGSEILNRISERWAPMGPAGIEGETFETSFLYLLDTTPDRPSAPETQRPPGLYADADHAITIPLPGPSAALYRLVLLPLDLSEETPLVRTNLTYQDNETLKQRSYGFEAEDIPAVWQQELLPGLLKIEPNQPVVARLFRVGSNAELTPERMLLPAYQLQSGDTLSYKLNPETPETQPIRLDVRAFSFDSARPSTLITARFLDDRGRILEQKDLEISDSPSALQRLAADPSRGGLSEPQRTYLSASASASQLVLETDGSALVSVYTRPLNKAIARVLPDQLRPWQENDERAPNWYLAQPDQAQQLIRQKRRHLIEWFYDLIELNAEVTAGNYEWEALKTREPRPQRQLLHPINEDAPLRDEARSSTFALLPRSGIKLAMDSSISGVAFTPQVIYSRESSAPTRVTFTRDGEPWYERGIAGSSGQFSLPALSRGDYQFSTRADGRWYINYNQSRGTHRRRLAYDLPAEGLRFEVTKSAAEEVVTLQFFADPSLKEAVVTVNILGADRRSDFTENYTFFVREYTIRPSGGGTLNIGSRQADWSEPLRVGIPLGADLPAGSYQIAIDGAQGLPVMVSAYRILEGEKAPYRFFVESQHEE